MPQQTAISAIGEFGLIGKIAGIVEFPVDDTALRENLLRGISDDAAVYRTTPGNVQLLTTDAFSEGVHFDLTYTSLRHLGWKVMAANFSDIAAMGGSPRYAVISLVLPRKVTVEMVEEFYSGAALACKTFSCLIAGGDTITTVGNMVISAAVTGEAREDRVVYRSGAIPGDYLCVTGDLGASIAGLKILQREKARYGEAGFPADFEPNLKPYAVAVGKHLMPKPRLDLSMLMTDHVRLSSMIDISDGLASEVHHLCTAGNVGASVYEHNLPVHAVTQRIAEEFSEPVTDYLLYGGEEYELLFTLSEAEQAKLEPLTSDITIIGRITDAAEGCILVRENGEQESLKPGGWDHFPRT